MRLKIFLLISIFLSLPFWGIAQEPAEPADSESINSKETRLFDEFSSVGDCELSARVNNFFIEMGNNPGSKGFIIVYRGAESLPAYQTEKALESHIERINQQIDFLRLDKNRIEIVDGGFRKNSSFWNEVWIVPEGGIIPRPSETVEKAKTPTDEAFKVDQGFLENSEALIKKDEEISDETEEITEEVPENSVETETPEIENSNELPQEVDEEYREETDPFYWFSDYFAEALNANQDGHGLVIFYTDEEEYDVAKSRQIVEAGLQNLADKAKADLSKVKIIFGGFRDENRVEYWIVPKGAKDPEPTPEQKAVKETENSSVN